jgi:hypothetical protein
MPNTSTPETNYPRRFGDLEEPLADVVVWAGLLNKIIEHDFSRSPEMSKKELDRLSMELEHVNDGLKEAVDCLDNLYHERAEEKAENA